MRAPLHTLFAVLLLFGAACGGGTEPAGDEIAEEPTAAVPAEEIETQPATRGQTTDEEIEPAAAPEEQEAAATPDEQEVAAGSDGDEHAAEQEDEHADDGGGGHEHDSVALGRRGDPDAADRTVAVVMTEFAYEPPVISVDRGETITFVITNDGQVAHEFTLGDEHFQQEHEREMQQMAGSAEAMAHDDPNMIHVEPGETRELTWTFEEPGEIQYACHLTGHYDAGMVGVLTVDG